ncbi:hypothetical protein PR048_030473 [Dryococelus australis]|uniref:Uncharacterized protein n=1 Tax=Dryococelus australis TaxID=614101 RepID=A0ABQ9GBS5_9NEOP|nr:hypothetical protein PR048_030473 [Dryococelus australis]
MNTQKSVGINSNGMVGQIMDGAGNMRGWYNGLKSVVLRESSTAFYGIDFTASLTTIWEKALHETK